MRALLVLLLLPCLAYADIEGKVVGITDGDTITVLDSENIQHKVRLAGIDAPERGQPFGQKSKEVLSSCAYGHQAHIEGRKLDRYGRLVGKVLVNGQDCNLNQVKQGMAWHYKKYEAEQHPEDRLLYSEVEIQARNMKIGLWIDKDAMAPWDFRKK